MNKLNRKVQLFCYIEVKPYHADDRILSGESGRVGNRRLREADSEEPASFILLCRIMIYLVESWFILLHHVSSRRNIDLKTVVNFGYIIALVVDY